MTETEEERYCEKCDNTKGDTPTETVNGHPGWKCSKCSWWNWIKRVEDEV